MNILVMNSSGMRQLKSGIEIVSQIFVKMFVLSTQIRGLCLRDEDGGGVGEKRRGGLG
jgi:hypothetical protein